jgi:hypothetical protein
MTTTEAHSICSVAGRHPLHAVAAFASAAARIANVYTAADVGKAVLQTDTLQWWLVASQAAGVATFRQIFLNSFNPDAPPASPSANDDECNGAVINAKWTTWDPAAYQARAASPGNYTYRITGTGNGADRQGGLRQAVPASEFAFAAKVGLYGSNALGRWLSAGIFVAGDIATNPATAALEIAQVVIGTTATPGDFSTQYSAWTNYQTSGANRGVFPCTGTAVYLMGRINGTTCAFDVSTDGVSWQCLGSAVAGFTPAYFGFTVNNLLNAVNRGGILHWFRVLGTGAGTSTFGALYPGVVGD